MKTAFVFGHTSGLGYAVSHTLLEKGYRVVGFARTESKQSSTNLINIRVDLTKHEDIKKTTDLIYKTYPTFDTLIYCSGALTAHDISNLNYQETERLYRILVFAPMMIESSLVALIKKNKADVVNITSSVLTEHYPAFTEYTTAKAAMEKFTKSLEIELNNTGARTMEFRPGAFQSNIYKHMTGDKIQRSEEKQPKAEDYAKVLVYLLDLPKHIRVHSIYIDKNS